MKNKAVGERAVCRRATISSVYGKVFQSDLAFLAEHPQYLLQELTNTLRLYAFSWCAQLALNIDNWQDGEPQSKSLFFILDSEKASSEREKVKRYGYKLFASQSEKLFPVLSALEVCSGEKDRKSVRYGRFIKTL